MGEQTTELRAVLCANVPTTRSHPNSCLSLCFRQIRAIDALMPCSHVAPPDPAEAIGAMMQLVPSDQRRRRHLCLIASYRC